MFGHIEKSVKKRETIFLPSTYHEIFKEHGTVRILGSDWRVYGHKTLADQYETKTNVGLRET